ncbi:hypothetical protein BDF22DRAFT_779606 [Syncephalis plumigaleata]|nr:hypothetical protein BDF22DRAFT_779606 [Syncephalis plumigaleata]
MRFNLGLTGVIATTMLLLASTTNAAITTTDSSLPSGRQGHTLSRRNKLGYIVCEDAYISGSALTNNGQQYQCKTTTAPCAQTYVNYLNLVRASPDKSQRMVQTILAQSEFYAGLQFAHTNHYRIFPIPNNLCFDAKNRLMFRVVGNGILPVKKKTQYLLSLKKKSTVILVDLLRMGSPAIDVLTATKFVESRIESILK